jgi:hypothetical protein
VKIEKIVSFHKGINTRSYNHLNSIDYYPFACQYFCLERVC